MADLTVRFGSQTDYEEVLRFYDRVVEANSGTEYDVLWNREVHPSDKEIRDAIEAGTLYLGFLDGMLVASSVVDDTFTEGYDTVSWKYTAEAGKVLCIHLFATEPTSQGRGLGRAFLQAIIEDTRARGIVALRLDAFKHNVPACALYEKVGFECLGEADLIYEDEDLPRDLPIVAFELLL